MNNLLCLCVIFACFFYADAEEKVSVDKNLSLEIKYGFKQLILNDRKKEITMGVLNTNDANLVVEMKKVQNLDVYTRGQFARINLGENVNYPKNLIVMMKQQINSLPKDCLVAADNTYEGLFPEGESLIFGDALVALNHNQQIGAFCFNFVENDFDTFCKLAMMRGIKLLFITNIDTENGELMKVSKKYATRIQKTLSVIDKNLEYGYFFVPYGRYTSLVIYKENK